MHKIREAFTLLCKSSEEYSKYFEIDEELAAKIEKDGGLYANNADA